MHICIFEDELFRNLFPLSYFRPVFDLRPGILTLRERIHSFLPTANLILSVRDYLAPLVNQKNPGTEVNTIAGDACLFINGRCVMTETLAKELRKAKEDCLFIKEDVVVAACLSEGNLRRVSMTSPSGLIDFSPFASITQVVVDAPVVTYPWDLVYSSESELVRDFQIVTDGEKGKERSGDIHRSAALLSEKDIYIGKKSDIGPGAVLDARSGPIYIGSNVTVDPQAVIEGPCFVGDGSVIRVGSAIYGNTSIGPLCKVGGEVTNSILHACVNKQHHGFLGHSYIAPWVNLGAGTTTSNLKNTYGTVKVHVNGRLVDSGRMFVGLTAGDHAKTGINATLDTGTVIGPSCNIFGTALPSKYVPPFSWGDATSLETYEVEKALEVAMRVMARRHAEVSEPYKQVFRRVFAMTEHERRKHTA